jgi:type II secretory pathway component PulJ
LALSLFAAVAVFILQGFVAATAQPRRSNERAAAATLAMQVMEQIRASVDPYAFVNFNELPGTPVDQVSESSPYRGLINPTPHRFDVAVTVARDPGCTLITATVDIYRPVDAEPFVTVATVLDNH